MKTRLQKSKLYNDKYANIPKEYNQRLAWLTDELKLDSSNMEEIIATANSMKDDLYFTRFFIVLYEIPEGAPRPRFRVLRHNVSRAALLSPKNIMVYSPTGKSDNTYFKKLMTNEDFKYFDSFIYTPCIVTYKAYLPTPTKFNKVQKFLAEMGCIVPTSKPDWDNIGKKYCDMTNSNLWVDDRLVIKGTVEKYYSVLPRVEITIDYLNQCLTKYDAESIQKMYTNGNIKYYGDGRLD